MSTHNITTKHQSSVFKMAVKSFREIVGAGPSTVSAKNSALVIIDAQNEYSKGKLAVSNVDSSRKVIAKVLEHYRKSGGKVVHVKHKTPEGAPVFTPSSELAQEFDELSPKSAEKTIEKVHPSSFADTDLDQYLRGAGVSQIVLTGYMVGVYSSSNHAYQFQAHVCVSTTARDGARFGYDVAVVSDGIGDRDIPGASGDEVTKMVLLELADAFATIVTSDQIQ